MTKLFCIWIIMLSTFLSGCNMTAGIKSALEERKTLLYYAHDSAKKSKNSRGTLTIESFVVKDVLSPEMGVTRISKHIYPFFFYNYNRQEFQTRLGYAQIQNDYKDFMRESFIEELKRSSKFVVSEKYADYSLKVTVNKIDMSAPVNSIRFNIFMVNINRLLVGSIDIAVHADVAVTKKGIEVLKKELLGRHSHEVLLDNTSNVLRDYTVDMIEGLSFAIKDLNERIVTEVNQFVHAPANPAILSQPNDDISGDTHGPVKAVSLKAESGGTYKDPVTGMELVLVKGGCYRMGDVLEEGDRNERPAHDVCVDDFYVGKYEVTQEQWKAGTGQDPKQRKEGVNYPAGNVTWDDAQFYLYKLSRKSGRHYRLPTEAEWEYAARSGGKEERWAGTNSEKTVSDFAWYHGKEAHPVGLKKPNGLGIHDMSGNIKEWVTDRYDEDYYKRSPRDNPQGPQKNESAVFEFSFSRGGVKGNYSLRGGSYDGSASEVRTTTRDNNEPNAEYNDFGFRVALPIK